MIAKEFQNVRLGIAGRVVEPDYYEELKKLVNDRSQNAKRQVSHLSCCTLRNDQADR